MTYSDSVNLELRIHKLATFKVTFQILVNEAFYYHAHMFSFYCPVGLNLL